MELIDYDEFGRFDIGRFAQPGRGVIHQDDITWRGGVWACDAVGAATCVFLHESMPDVVGGLEIDFRDLSERDTLAFFDALHLPLRPGMSLQQVQTVLGEPTQRVDFIEDRRGYGFEVGSRYPYEVGCIIRDSVGLIYVSVIRKDAQRRAMECDN
jgi:hypothetical protein